MSAGGQRTLDLSGVTGMRIMSGSDFTTQLKDTLVYQTFNSSTGANAFANHVANGNDYYLQFLKGVKECSNCTGLPYQMGLTMKFRY
jgi:predicted double-glycine peptidase